MTESRAVHASVYQLEDQDTVLASANVLLRRRRTIISLGLLGVAIGLTWGLLSPRLYMSTATFIPQGAAEGSTAAIALKR